MVAGGRNVVLLTLDALRADHVSSYGYDRETTPNFDRFPSVLSQAVSRPGILILSRVMNPDKLVY